MATGSLFSGPLPGGVVGTINLEDLADVVITSVATDDFLISDGTEWLNISKADLVTLLVPDFESSISLENLFDVDFGTLGPGVDQYHIIYNHSTGNFELAASPSGGATQLDELSDVTLSTPATGDLLQRDGSGQFINVSLAAAGVAAASHAHALSDITGLVAALAGKEDTSNKGIAGGYASLDGTGKVPASQLPAAAGVTQLDDLSDVVLSSVTTGDLLQADGSGDFINVSLATAGIAAVSHTHVVGDITGLATDLSGKEDISNRGIAYGYAQLNGSARVTPTNAPLMSDLGGFTQTGVVDGDIVVYDSGAYVTQTPVLDSLDDVNTTGAVTGMALIKQASGDYEPRYVSTNIEQLQQKRGTVSAAGAVSGGTGFTVTKLGTGNYRVNFTTPFSSAPSVVASIASPSPAANDRTIRVFAYITTSFDIQIATTAGTNVDEIFSWVALGG